MLRLLTDEHISPEVMRGVLERRPGAKIVSVLFWDHGKFVGSPDAVLLTDRKSVV